MKRLLVAITLSLFIFSAYAAPSPNLVIFIADDMSYYDVGCWGSPDAKTPNLDKLASEGMKLTRCYTPAPVCSPTRLALYTALYPVKNGGYPNHSATKPGIKSMVHFLKPLGYRVGIVGKAMIAPEETFPFDYLSSPAGEKEAKPTGETFDPNEDIDFRAIKKYTKDTAQPFCLVVASHQPHGPWDKGDGSTYDPKKIHIPPYIVDTPETREERARYLAEVTHLDAEVGRVIKMLEQAGQIENTLFIFLSEQGSSFPGGKYNLYDAGIRAAAIARWPGKIKAGSENDAICSYVDIIPTFIEAAGGKPVAGLDGRSIMSVLTGKTNRHLEYVFAQSTSLGVKGVTTPYAIRAVRDDRYKLIWNLNHENEFPCSRAAHSHTSSWVIKAKTDPEAGKRLKAFLQRPEFELYDLKTDPWELTNIALDPKHRETISRLRQQLEAWMRDQGDLGVQTELDAEKRLKKNLRKGQD
jgi:N-sulfoglucosamine sulfohydrolase